MTGTESGCIIMSGFVLVSRSLVESHGYDLIDDLKALRYPLK